MKGVKWMDRFYIKQLRVSGGQHADSVVDFKLGVNLILGPSNTGKTLLVDCIDYIFGVQDHKSTAIRVKSAIEDYKTISLLLETLSGYSLLLQRDINNSKVYVDSNHPNIKTDNYSVNHSAKKNISTVLLSLIGIQETHKILKNQKGDIQNLTWRSLLHLFLIKQNDVPKESSILINSSAQTNLETSSMASLLYLINQHDATEVKKNDNKDIIKAKRDVLIEYIKKKITQLYEKQDNLMQIQSEYQNIDLASKIKEIKEEIINIQEQINNVLSDSQKNTANIQRLSIKLSEAYSIANGFNSLKQQYDSDIQRIQFIIEGHNHLHDSKERFCPICDSRVEKILDPNYLTSSDAELNKLNDSLSELSKAQRSIEEKIKAYHSSITKLEIEQKQLNVLLNSTLYPKLDVLNSNLDEYVRIKSIQHDIATLAIEINMYKEELFEKENTVIPKETEYKIKESYEFEIIKKFEDILTHAIKQSKFEKASYITFNRDMFDLELNGKPKVAFAGGGYCSVLNTLVAFSMLQLLIQVNGLAPNFLIVDSALSQLSESKYKDSSDMIKRNFIKYLATNSQNIQVILVEHEEKIPQGIKEIETANIIEFTKDKNNGRYGFLNDIY